MNDRRPKIADPSLTVRYRRSRYLSPPVEKPQRAYAVHGRPFEQTSWNRLAIGRVLRVHSAATKGKLLCQY
jgi:hypothetical protein